MNRRDGKKENNTVEHFLTWCVSSLPFTWERNTKLKKKKESCFLFFFYFTFDSYERRRSTEVLKPKQVRQRQKKKNKLSTLLFFFNYYVLWHHMLYDPHSATQSACSLPSFFRLETHILGCELKCLACSSVICKQSRRQRTQNHVATTSGGYLRLLLFSVHSSSGPTACQ